MPEGIFENLPPKKPGIVKRITWAVKENLPWDPIGKKKRSVRGLSNEEITSITMPPKPADEERKVIPLLPNLEANIKASERLMKSIRNPSRYSQNLYRSQYMKSDLGFLVTKPVEQGWFDVSSVVTTAGDRYQLPLAIYVDHNHAQLVVKGAYQAPEGRKITVYNPMHNGFEEIHINETGMPMGVTANGLVGSKIDNGEYDITGFFGDPELLKYRDLLVNIKAFNFQKDLQNCIPYCLYVNAMLYGLEPGVTGFKREGIKKFKQDFGVRILTREEIMGKEILSKKPRVRIIE